MWSYAAAATRRRGELLGDESLIEAADATMRSRGVANPKRMASMHLAGFRI